MQAKSFFILRSPECFSIVIEPEYYYLVFLLLILLTGLLLFFITNQFPSFTLWVQFLFLIPGWLVCPWLRDFILEETHLKSIFFENLIPPGWDLHIFMCVCIHMYLYGVPAEFAGIYFYSWGTGLLFLITRGDLGLRHISWQWCWWPGWLWRSLQPPGVSAPLLPRFPTPSLRKAAWRPRPPGTTSGQAWRTDFNMFSPPGKIFIETVRARSPPLVQKSFACKHADLGWGEPNGTGEKKSTAAPDYIRAVASREAAGAAGASPVHSTEQPLVPRLEQLTTGKCTGSLRCRHTFRGSCF